MHVAKTIIIFTQVPNYMLAAQEQYELHILN